MDQSSTIRSAAQQSEALVNLAVSGHSVAEDPRRRRSLDDAGLEIARGDPEIFQFLPMGTL